MTTFNELATEMASYAHASNDVTVIKECIVNALRALRHRRVKWGEATATFVTEPNVAFYPFGSYPNLPGDIMSFTTDPIVTVSALAGAVLQPDTLVTQTNLTGSISDVQDSAEEPDDDYLDPTAAATWTMEVRWDVALSRPLVPGASKQIMRVLMYNEGTDRTVAWKIKEGGSDVTGASGSWTVNSTTPTVYEAKWDAALLSTLNPAANQISLHVTDASSGGDVHIGAVQWFTATRTEHLTTTTSQSPIRIINVQNFRELERAWPDNSFGTPWQIAIFNERMYFYPTPNSTYLVTFDYQKDSTRDETTGNKITTSSTTETNGWFDEGKMELVGQALMFYHSLRPHNAKAAQLAAAAKEMAEEAQEVAYDQALLSQLPRGYL